MPLVALEKQKQKSDGGKISYQWAPRKQLTRIGRCLSQRDYRC